MARQKTAVIYKCVCEAGNIMSDNAENEYSGELYRQFAELHLQAAGFEDTASIVYGLYEKCLPNEGEFKQEVEVFAEHYRQAMEKAEYLRLIEELAGEDASSYKTLYEEGRTSEGRLLNGGVKYEEALNKIPDFNPCSLEECYRRFDDFPNHIHRDVYQESLQLALDRLKEKAPG